MKYAVFCLLAFTTLSTIAWIATYRRRRLVDVESVMAKLDPFMLSLTHIDYGPSPRAQRELQDAMWKSVHGMRGIATMCRNAGILLTVAAVMAQDHTDTCQETYASICARAAMLRFAWIFCLLENILVICFRRIPIPRWITRLYLDEYMQMCAEIRVILEYYNPSLIDRFDALV